MYYSSNFTIYTYVSVVNLDDCHGNPAQMSWRDMVMTSALTLAKVLAELTSNKSL